MRSPAVPPEERMTGVYKDTWGWNVGFAAYWFATSYKWFILLTFVLPDLVAKIVGDADKNSAWGMVYGIGAVWAVFGPAIFGTLSDRINTRFGHRQPFIAAGAGLTVLAVWAVGSSTTIFALTLAYLLLQVADDVGTGPYGGMVPEVVPEHRRGFASAVMTLLQRLAEIATALAAIVLQRPDLILVGIAVVNVLCAAWTIRSISGLRPAERPPDKPRAPWHRAWIDPWFDHDFRWLWFTRLLTSAAAFLVTNYMLNYLKDMFPSFRLFGIDLGDAGRGLQLLGLTLSIGASVGALIAVRLADTVGRKRLVYISGWVISLMTVPFALARDYTAIWAMAIVLGVGSGVRGAVDWAMAADIVPDKDEAGGQMGLWSSSQTAVQILVGGAGAVIQHLNEQNMGVGYVSAIWLAGLLFLVGTFLVQKVRGSS
ncbi:MAG: MFS transporter [Fimbriimonadaceae bacterium]|nr:MFS transporter [Fimbriimonadaceae bacterium]QYK55361.1 MAG: MFS transporter [Fimbriimonadaceae bacterium]